MPDFNFVGASYVAASITQDDQELINYYCETDPTEYSGSRSTGIPADRTVTALYPCPGTRMLTQLATIGPVRGFGVLPGGTTLLAVCGTALYSITLSYVATQVGALLTSTGPVSITNNGVSAYLCDGSNRYFYTPATNTFAIVADGAFNGANTVDIIDNFIVYNNPSSNQWGCTNVGSVVSGALNFASMLVAPGNCIGLICDHRNVFILGERVSEVWNDVGSSPFPFAIVPGTSMQHGCAARGSIARLGESFAFLAQDDRGQAVVIHMQGYSPTRISTHAVEQAMNGYAIISDAVSYSYQQNGHEFYMLTFPTADITWCYDLATGLWHKRAWRDQKNVYHRHRSNCCAVFGGKIIVGDYANGRIYQLDLTVFTDATGMNGAAELMPCLRRARHLTTDLKRQFFNDLQIQFQPGIGLTGAEVASGANFLSISGIAASKDSATTPDSSAISITGDIDLIAYVVPADWNDFDSVILVKGGSATSDVSYHWELVFGKFTLLWSPDGGSTILVSNSTILSFPFTNGVGAWIRATLQVNDGLGNHVVKFYTSITDAPTVAPASVTWIQYGNAVTTAGTTSIFDSTATLFIGNGPVSQTESPMKIYLANIYKGIGGTIASSFNPQSVLAGATSFTSPTGEIYTLNGAAFIAGNFVPRIQGVNPQAWLKWSDDGGFTFSNEHWAFLGKTGAYKNRAIWRNLGQARDRIFEVGTTDPVYRVIASANLNSSPGAH